MRLHVLGTGSAGNAYLLEHSGHALLLDAGLPWKKLLAAFPGGIGGIEGCLITHEHQDHSKAVCDLLVRGVECWTSWGTMEMIFPRNALDSMDDFPCLRLAVHDQEIRLPHFTVKPFKTEHDAAEPLGYLIRHNRTGETLLYATDTYFLRYTFPGVHYWLVECNYTMQLARESLGGDPKKKPLFNRLMESHMSLERLLEALAANDLREARKIVLIHLSDERSDEARMVAEVESATWIKTIAACAGAEIELALTPF